MKIEPLADRVLVEPVEVDGRIGPGISVPDTQLVKEGGEDFGNNICTGEYKNLIADGMMDPAKVATTALRNAASGGMPDDMI